MMHYALTIFLSAFLLFQIQPIVGKFILPQFGGGSSIWSACLVFFQIILLSGYAYAHLISKLAYRYQIWIHLALLTVSLYFIPISSNKEFWTSTSNQTPTLAIIIILFINIGFPYFLLSSTGPLLQKWFHKSYTKNQPYRLYALSNAGSLLSLLAYPFIVEPFINRINQALLWSIGYLFFLFFCTYCSFKLLILIKNNSIKPATKETANYKLNYVDVLLWFGLSASASALLISTTNQLTKDVASIPFLWILPLSLYLVSFILCFDHPRWYNRKIFATLLFLATFYILLLIKSPKQTPILIEIFIYSTFLFASCMTCHGELSRLKPHPSHLTFFYLIISIGGAFGGLLVSLVAPFIFSGYWEYYLVIIASLTLTTIGFYRGIPKEKKNFKYKSLFTTIALVEIIVSLTFLSKVSQINRSSIHLSRNFYGTLRISEDQKNKKQWLRSLTDGNTIHGSQFIKKDKQQQPTTYYNRNSGIGLALSYQKLKRGNIQTGVIGLGAGTLACYGKRGDYIRFYEINPEIERISRTYFTYLEDSKAKIDVIIGDARLSIEKDIANKTISPFDVFVVDAFSSDSIPIHLLTLESIKLYWKLLKEEGLLAIHISNRYLKLEPVIKGLLTNKPYRSVKIKTVTNRAKEISASNWIIIAQKNHNFFQSKKTIYKQIDRNNTLKAVYWTDDYASLWNIVDFN